MSSGITLAKILVAFVLIALVLGAEPLIDVVRHPEAWPWGTPRVRLPSAPPVAAAATTVTYERRPVKNARRSSKRAVFEAYDVPAGTVLPALLRAPLDSRTTRVEARVGALLRTSVKQGSRVLIPAASILQGKVIDVIPSSRWQPRGRIVVGFYFIEHSGTASRTRIAAQPVVFEPVDTTGNNRTADVRVNAGELLHVTLTEPVNIRLPK